MIQGSDEWFAARLGNVTASRVADVMAKTKSGPAASRTNYMMELLCQRLTGRFEDGFTSSAMQRGTDLEPVARAHYERITETLVDEIGIIKHPAIDRFAASPDGLVGADGMLEIKCPNTAQHIKFLQTGTPDMRYRWQMTAQMECAGRNWCDFVSFDDRLPKELQFHSIRYKKDDDITADMNSAIQEFLAELETLELAMKELAEKRAA